MATEAQVVDATLAKINAVLPSSVRAYEPGKVPDPRPNEFLSVTIVRRSGGTGRSGRYATKGWSVYLMAASMTSAANARNALRIAADEIESKPLAVAGEQSTPVRFDNGRPVAPDDGWFTGSNTYHFAI